MARTVGLPVAISADIILNWKGNIPNNLLGVIAPIYKEIYLPILEELEKNGIKMIEKDNIGKPESIPVNHLK